MTRKPNRPRLVTPDIVPLDAAADQRVIDEIERHIANPPPPYHSVPITFTSGACAIIRARGLLGTHNRNDKPSSIASYAEDMAKDGWKENGSTVVFTDQGVVGDGKHRILACIRSGRPFTTAVMFNVPHGNFFSMDQGKVRGPADLLTIHGVANANFVYPAVRWAELLADIATIHRRHTFKGPEILRLYDLQHRAVEDFLREAKDVVKVNPGHPVSLVMALLYSFDKVDSGLAAEFSKHWINCSYPGSFRAISIMQHELAVLAVQAKKSGTRIHDLVRPAMIVNVWNIVRQDLKPRAAIINWNTNLTFPAIR